MFRFRNRAKEETERHLEDIAKILANMMFIGIEKRGRCIHYRDGICTYIKLDVPIPHLSTVKDGDGYRIQVSKHPEVCAVCPFWKASQNAS